MNADAWARTVLTLLRTGYPYAAGHTSRTADDVEVTPERLHPVFHGSFDWHSSAHMQPRRSPAATSWPPWLVSFALLADQAGSASR
ncbi:MAG: DUF2891 family protein [Microlunatus sp.]|nr:DUF2891 family protein [Microlunatus sp.]